MLETKIKTTTQDNYALQKKREVTSLHDKYLNDPEIKLHWYEKYNKQEVLAFSLSLLFMSVIAFLVIYFVNIGYFKPALVDKTEMTVRVKSIIKQGDVLIRVVDEELLEKTAKGLDKKLEKGLTNSKNISSQSSLVPPNTNISMSNGISIQVDPLSRPFDIVVGDWLHKCHDVVVNPGDEIQVNKNMYYRPYDKSYFYKIVPVTKVCENLNV